MQSEGVGRHWMPSKTTSSKRIIPGERPTCSTPCAAVNFGCTLEPTPVNHELSRMPKIPLCGGGSRREMACSTRVWWICCCTVKGSSSHSIVLSFRRPATSQFSLNGLPRVAWVSEFGPRPGRVRRGSRANLAKIINCESFGTPAWVVHTSLILAVISRALRLHSLGHKI